MMDHTLEMFVGSATDCCAFLILTVDDCGR